MATVNAQNNDQRIQESNVPTPSQPVKKSVRLIRTGRTLLQKCGDLGEITLDTWIASATLSSINRRKEDTLEYLKKKKELDEQAKEYEGGDWKAIKAQVEEDIQQWL